MGKYKVFGVEAEAELYSLCACVCVCLCLCVYCANKDSSLFMLTS